MESFRVPKKKNTEVLELLTINSEQRKYLISTITDSFKKPEISKVAMKFHQSWLINNPESEKKFSKRRLEMKNKSSNHSESFGFLYLKTEFELKNLVKVGQIPVGNLPQSHLGRPEMGVSISQHADLYHPDPLKAGLILVVKYIKGKVCYLPADPNPMEPQPNFDCHAVRPSPSHQDLSSQLLNKAFHATQCFVYEYSPDLEIERFPSQILLVGAVRFSWHGPFIYRQSQTSGTELKPVVTTVGHLQNGLKRSQAPVRNTVVVKHIRLSSTPLSLVLPPKLPNNIINNQMPYSAALSTVLIIGNHQSSPRVGVRVVSRLKESPVMAYYLITHYWKLIELMPENVLEEYMVYFDYYGVERRFQLTNSVVNVFPSRFNERKKMGGFFRPKYAMVFQIIPQINDTREMSKIIGKFLQTKTVGLVRCNSLSNVLVYIFPTGRISKVLGLPNLDPVCSLNAVLLTEHHPDFLLCLHDSNSKVEQKTFQTFLLEYEKYFTHQIVDKFSLSLSKLKSLALEHIEMNALSEPSWTPKTPTDNIIHNINNNNNDDNNNVNVTYENNESEIIIKTINNNENSDKIENTDIKSISQCENIDYTTKSPNQEMPTKVDIFPSHLLTGDVDYRFLHIETGKDDPSTVVHNGPGATINNSNPSYPQYISSPLAPFNFSLPPLPLSSPPPNPPLPSPLSKTLSLHKDSLDIIDSISTPFSCPLSVSIPGSVPCSEIVAVSQSQIVSSSFWCKNKLSSTCSNLHSMVPVTIEDLNVQHCVPYIDAAEAYRKETTCGTEFIGKFNLVNLSQWRKFQRQIHYAPRRPTYLDSAIFERMVVENSHFSVYKG